MYFKNLDTFESLHHLNLDISDISIGEKDALICMKELKQSNMIALGHKNNGLSIMDVSLTKSRITLYAHFLDGKSIKDIVEVDQNLILAVTFINPEYFIIDL